MSQKTITKPLSDQRRYNMVEDLVRKYPYGPRGQRYGFSKSHYSVDDRWSSHHAGYRKLVTLIGKKEGESFGYSNLEIYKLNFHSPYSVREYLREKWPTISRMAISKRSNRIWVRIQNAVREIREKGSTGIYRVRFGGQRQAYVHANSTEDAEIYAEAMLRIPLKVEEGYRCTASFETIGDALMLAGKNTKIADDWRAEAQARVSRLEDQLAKALANLEETEISASMIESLAGFQIAEMESPE